MKTCNKGFTIVEMSMVVLVISLIVVGVVVGQDIIKQANIRTVVTTVNEVNISLNSFRTKYRQLPGDFTKASDYGINSPKGSSTVNVSSTADNADSDCADTTDCDGDGDGVLESVTLYDAMDTNTNHGAFEAEIANFWVHLSNSGFIKEVYSQTAGCSGESCNMTRGSAMPSLPVGNAMIALSNDNRVEYALGVDTPFEIAPTNYFNAAGKQTNSVAGYNLTPEEAYGIDQKLDDGQPEEGVVQIFTRYNGVGSFTVGALSSGLTCIASSGADYDMNFKDSKICNLRVRSSG
jgi:prepilin-type N-terminal cleavage/methylation domain-containing protein